MYTVKLSNGYATRDLGTIVSIQEIWLPWKHESDTIMGFYISGIQDLASKIVNFNLSKLTKTLSSMSVFVGVTDIRDFFRLKEDFNKADKIVRWNTLPDDYSDLSCVVKLECKVKSHILKEYEEATEGSKHQLKRLIDHEFAKTICNLNIALALAKPGAFQISPSRGSIPKTFWQVNNFSKFWYIVPTHMERVGWPHFRNLPTELVWRWLCEQPGIFTGRSNLAVPKAVCIFTRLFRQHYLSDEMQDIVWSVSGVESLLGEGGRSVIGSLKEKLRLIFPDIDGAKIDINKTIKSSYQLRSSLVHGSERIVGNFNCINDNENQEEARIEEVFMASIFVCLLQTAFTRKLKSFDFEYILR